MDYKDIERRVGFLRRVQIFRESPDSLLAVIAENLSEMEVSVNDHIVLKGELGDSMYIILDGRVKVHDGEYIFSTLKTGDVFGKYYLLDNIERSATVTALSHTFLLRFRQEDFYRITRNENTVIKGILRTLVGRLRDMNEAEEQLAEQNLKILHQKEELERQKAELLELNTTKDKFFSIIAHDLRSPITTLISLSEVLHTDMELLEPDQQKEILQSLNMLSRNYLKLLDNLLQWARIQTGRLRSEPSLFDVSEVITEMINFYRPYALDKQIRLLAEHLKPVQVFADKNILRLVLRNLISNAIKFTQPDGEVDISLVEMENQVEISVRDNGLGMTGEVLQNLFRIDKTFSSPGTAGEKGTGLGLILSREFVEMNHGKINAESTHGYGSIFRFTVPKTV
jgi:signal transduction histidine kinase